MKPSQFLRITREIRSNLADKNKLLFSQLHGFDKYNTYWWFSDEMVKRMVKRLNSSTPHTNNPPGEIPAGYTYLGQMLIHEIVTDSDLSVGDVTSSALDLDSIYFELGSPNYVDLIDDQGRFKIGTSLPLSENPPFVQDDIMRIDGGINHGQARIPDGRNDENIIISQLHLVWQKFHNRAVDKLVDSGETDKDGIYIAAKTFVVLMFQRIIMDDYLDKISHPLLYNYYRDRTKSTFLAGQYFTDNNNGKVPIEFSHAAARFGHSMVRTSYSLNSLSTSFIDLIYIFGKNKYRGNDKLIGWERFFHLKSGEYDGNVVSRLGLNIASDLTRMPGKGWRVVFGWLSERFFDILGFLSISLMSWSERASLWSMSGTKASWLSSYFLKFFARVRLRQAIRNLISLDLVASSQAPLGKDILNWIEDTGYLGALENETGISFSEVNNNLDLNGSGLDSSHGIKVGKNDTNLDTEVLAMNRLPLWLFVLREAEVYPPVVDGGSADRLGPLGSFIVLETIRESINMADTSIMDDVNNYKSSLRCLWQLEDDFLLHKEKIVMKDIFEY